MSDKSCGPVWIPVRQSMETRADRSGDSGLRRVPTRREHRGGVADCVLPCRLGSSSRTGACGEPDDSECGDRSRLNAPLIAVSWGDVGHSLRRTPLAGLPAMRLFADVMHRVRGDVHDSPPVPPATEPARGPYAFEGVLCCSDGVAAVGRLQQRLAARAPAEHEAISIAPGRERVRRHAQPAMSRTAYLESAESWCAEAD